MRTSSVMQYLCLLSKTIPLYFCKELYTLQVCIGTGKCSLFSFVSLTRHSAVTESWWLNDKDDTHTHTHNVKRDSRKSITGSLEKWDRSPHRTSAWSTMRWVNTVVTLWCTAEYLETVRPVDAISSGYLRFSLCSHLSPLHLAVNLSRSPHSHLSSHHSWLPLLLTHYVHRWEEKNASSAKVCSWRLREKKSQPYFH